MQDKPMFWTVFKADLLFSICSISLSIIAIVAIAWWKKRRMKNTQTPQKNLEGPRAFIIGGTNPKPGHCPLCGLDWPMPGPIIQAPPTTPGAQQSEHR